MLLSPHSKCHVLLRFCFDGTVRRLSRRNTSPPATRIHTMSETSSPHSKALECLHCCGRHIEGGSKRWSDARGNSSSESPPLPLRIRSSTPPDQHNLEPAAAAAAQNGHLSPIRQTTQRLLRPPPAAARHLKRPASFAAATAVRSQAYEPVRLQSLPEDRGGRRQVVRSSKVEQRLCFPVRAAAGSSGRWWHGSFGHAVARSGGEERVLGLERGTLPERWASAGVRGRIYGMSVCW